MYTYISYLKLKKIYKTCTYSNMKILTMINLKIKHYIKLHTEIFCKTINVKET